MPCLPWHLFAGKGSMRWWGYSWKSRNWPSLTTLFAQLFVFKFLLILRSATWILPWRSIVPAPWQHVLTAFSCDALLSQRMCLHFCLLALTRAAGGSNKQLPDTIQPSKSHHLIHVFINGCSNSSCHRMVACSCWGTLFRPTWNSSRHSKEWVTKKLFNVTF